MLMQINGQTRIVAVLGHPIAHTASPAMHNAAFEKLRLNWRYIALDMNPSDLSDVLHGLALAGLVGVNLTVPHKLLAMKHLDRVDRSARDLKATNTIHFTMKEGRPMLTGHNTDGYGLLKALEEEFSFRPRGKTIAIVGCGGAGQGAAIQLALAGAKKIILLNRTRAKALAVARQIRSLKAKTKCIFFPEPCDLTVQATSLGLKSSDSLPLERSQLEKLSPKFFFDMIYRPAETPVMRMAKKTDSQVANGLEMLLHLGARAFEIWTGKKAPVEVMRWALRKEIYGR
jgi:shikimate dehydrogenase